jgi:signal transduction histidine kinase
MQRPAKLLRLLCGLLGALTLITSALGAARPLDASQMSHAPLSLTEHLALLEDPSGQLTLSEVQSPAVAQHFKTDLPASQALNFGYTQSAYWLRLELANSSDQPVTRMLEIAYARISDLQLYQPSADGAYTLIATGSGRAFASRPINNRYFVFALNLPAQSRQAYYLRLHSDSPLTVPARLWLPELFARYERNDYSAQAWYFGMASAMLLFNLLLFVTLRDAIYLLYVNAVLFMALAIAAQHGLSKEYLPFDSPLWSEISVGVSYSLAVMAILLFTRRMLNTADIAPRLDRLLKMSTWLLLLSLVGFLIDYQRLIQAATALYGAAALLIISSALYCAMKQQRSAYFFLIAFGFMGIAGAINSLRMLGLLPTNFVTQNGLQFGSGIEMIIMALALADRFNTLRRANERAQAALLHAEQRESESLRESERLLEARVERRTHELSCSIEQLKKTQAELLQAEKLASLGALVAGVAHELNTPIGNALTTATALEDASKTFQAAVLKGELRKSTMLNFVDNAVPMSELISRSCLRAANLISSFKQVAVDQTSEQRRQFDLRTLVDDHIAALRPSFKHAPWLIEVDIADGIALDSYPGPLGQVINNLLQNAIKHGFEGRAQGTLRISAKQLQNTVEIDFMDDGNGMPNEVLSHIFEPFYTTKLGHGGSGLGLSIALNIVTGVLGGTLNATSKQSYGTHFCLHLPLHAPAQTLPA